MATCASSMRAVRIICSPRIASWRSKYLRLSSLSPESVTGLKRLAVSKISPRTGSILEDGRESSGLDLIAKQVSHQRVATTTRTPSGDCQGAVNWVRVPSTPPHPLASLGLVPGWTFSGI